MFSGNDEDKLKQFSEILSTCQEADKIVKFKLKNDPANKNIWELAQEKLTRIKDLLDHRQIPTAQQKQQLNIGTMLARTFDTAEDSQELDPLFKLSNQFDMLGIKILSNDEALSLYNNLHQ